MAALVAGAAVVIWLGIAGGRSSGDAAANTLPPDTTQVTRRTLKDAHTADGELGYGTTSTATSRLPGTLTYLPDTSARITRNQPLYKLNNKPVTLMYGHTPAYRNLAAGVEGPDVKQLEQNLRALGYSGFTVDEEYTESTATAVKRWQEDQGLDETGVVELGRVVFAPAAIRIAGLQAAQGDPVAPGQRILSYTETAKAVTVQLDTADQRMAKIGAAVTVTLPDDSSVGGHISEVTTVIQPGEAQGDDPKTKVEVVVTLDNQKAADAYMLASVDVTFTAAERKDVLTVPVAALLALREGGFGVEVVQKDTSRYVAVRTGLFSDGSVEISGDGIAEGTTVGMPK
ncbi:peptidoglycan-binding protein [Micromonospora sp. NPDC047740]|uniref:peptidoglycan-binding protein n=1 Tax=Micromonospora sp. NPDC047740 TaxID=3364254 RepID=UPI00371C7515